MLDTDDQIDLLPIIGTEGVRKIAENQKAAAPKFHCSFRAYAIPKGQPRPKAFARNFAGKWMARVYTPGTAEAFKSAIATAAEPHIPKTRLMGPIKITLQVFFPRLAGHYRTNGQVKPNAPHWHTVKPDCDNVAKAVLDALTQISFFDDAQVCSVVMSKVYDDKPGVFVEVEAM